MGNNNNGNGGMMGGGGNSYSNGRGGAFDSADEGENMDKLAMLGALASVKGGAVGLWDSYNACLAEKPILVKVRLLADDLAARGLAARGLVVRGLGLVGSLIDWLVD